MLRGKDVETGEFSLVHREKQFAILQEAQAHVLNLRDWHQFLTALIGAGFRSWEMISPTTRCFLRMLSTLSAAYASPCLSTPSKRPLGAGSLPPA